MQSTVPARRDLVLIGGGHTHVAVLKNLGMNPCPGLRVTLLSPTPAAPYSGMLPGLLAGHYTPDQCHIELRPLCRFAQANFYQTCATGLDLSQHLVHCQGRPPVRFDFLSINCGATPDQSVPGASEFALPVKPVDTFLAEVNTRLAALNPHTHETPHWVVVGGGAGGVEVLLALHHRLQIHRVALHLVTASEDILPTHPAGVRQRYRRILQQRGVHLHVDCPVTEVLPSRLYCRSTAEPEIPYDALFWVTGVAPPSWIRKTGLATDERGFIAVNDCLQSVSHPFVFAAGDIASMLSHPRPKSGVFAVRQGAPLTENLRRTAIGKPLRPYRPQRQFLSLISTGNRYAVASRGNWSWEGAWVWRMKDRIDRRWMKRYQDLPDMAQGKHIDEPHESSPTSAKSGPRCGGCGSKVGADILHRILARLHPIHREDVLAGMDAREDAAMLRVPPGRISVQTVDFFRTMINDPFVFGKITAVHCLGDIYAMGAEPQSALATVCVPYGSDSVIEETIYQMLEGALEIFNGHHTTLAGGHTAESGDLALGFTVNGLADEKELLHKGGLQPGDHLILTKPVGTGALLAADMLGQARGHWMESALATMQQSARTASLVLRRHGVQSCTDVTGFGVLGHLLEMLRASGARAEIDVSSLPALDGAMACMAGGHLSTLHPQNKRFAQQVADLASFLSQEKALLWLDPQTAGGLLAGVSSGRAQECLRILNSEGYTEAAVIGKILPTDPHSPLVLWA